ncbi:hypothetical protein L226DRAFT_41040 [Lentinus tigrinus ALCF2SS1-7]|uniref:uncharacterized protein n=1 Tax=Lentinus tigrinus ALCF2SS1-7 TaxID=1328758 RepID=UPI00116614E1|nr:hypothetical protein L226DRAFT_41040 [Lentinus tigrinus ALCF2SS1-7]
MKSFGQELVNHRKPSRCGSTAKMPTSITMNLDVLLAIMGFVVAMPADIAPHPSCTIASMMRANRALYHEGAKVLLSGEVRLGTEKPRNVSSFAECCLAENGIRLAYVRRLVLTARFYTTTSPAALSTLLPKFPNLISLSLLGWTESLFEGSEGEVSFFRRRISENPLASRGSRRSSRILGSAP